MLTKRTNILFEDDLWDLLTLVARREKSSIGQVVRTAVTKVYSESSILERKKKAFETIRGLRAKQKDLIDYKALINEGHKY